MRRIQINVSVNGTNTNYYVNEGTTNEELADNSTFRQDFGLGSNITCNVNGSSSRTTLRDGDTVSVFTRASSKAANIKIRVSVNGATTDYFVSPGSTLRSLANDTTFRQDMGISGSVDLSVGGNSDPTYRLRALDVVAVRTVASTKANG